MAPENDDTGEVAGEFAGEFDRLARRYLDLWQSQLAGLASDQALTEQIARLFAAANAQVASALQAAQGGQHGSQPSSTQTGSSPAGTPSRHGIDDVGELRKRVEALEARIAELESRLGDARDDARSDRSPPA